MCGKAQWAQVPKAPPTRAPKAREGVKSPPAPPLPRVIEVATSFIRAMPSRKRMVSVGADPRRSGILSWPERARLMVPKPAPQGVWHPEADDAQQRHADHRLVRPRQQPPGPPSRAQPLEERPAPAHPDHEDHRGAGAHQTQGGVEQHLPAARQHVVGCRVERRVAHQGAGDEGRDHRRGDDGTEDLQAKLPRITSMANSVPPIGML